MNDEVTKAKQDRQHGTGAEAHAAFDRALAAVDAFAAGTAKTEGGDGP